MEQKLEGLSEVLGGDGELANVAARGEAVRVRIDDVARTEFSNEQVEHARAAQAVAEQLGERAVGDRQHLATVSVHDVPELAAEAREDLDLAA